MTVSALSDHFRALAGRYQAVRSLDRRAARRIAKALARLPALPHGLRLLDVGTGTGRYLRAMGEELARRGVAVGRAVGSDASRSMLGRFIELADAADQPERPAPSAVSTRAVAAHAEALAFLDSSFDVVLTFNALHHLELSAFLTEAARVLAPRGHLVIYTRSAEQNLATIWGMHFPDFAARESRLYTRDDVRAALERHGAFTGVRLRSTAWWQFTSLPALVRQARARHYSTFRFYGPDEFAQALATFRERVRRSYACPWAIPVRNNHTIVTARRRG